MSEDYAAKSVRLVQPTGSLGGGRPSVAPPPPRVPTRMVGPVPNHSPAELAQFVREEQAREHLRATAERAAGAVKNMTLVQGQEPAQPAGTPESLEAAMGELNSFVGATANTESPPKTEQPPISSFDLEVLEMADDLDVGALILDGYVMRELPILDGAYSVSVRSLKKSDLTEIGKDVDQFRRGRLENPDDPDSKWITPFPHAVAEFIEIRRLAQGLLGLNGTPMTSRWDLRMAELEDLDAALFSAIVREYHKFLTAVSMLFPDKTTKETVQKLKDRLGKARSHI